MLIMPEAVHVCREEVWEISVPSSYFCYEPKIAKYK
jgi:hypothetical protein